MSRLTNLNNLEKLSKALDVRCKELIDEEKARALAEEQALQTEINTTKDMFGGKSIRYVTQAEYDSLSDTEKNSDTVTYFITDAVDLSHEHENKEFLDNLAARNIAIGNKSQSFDGVNDLVYSIEDIGAAPAEHNHDDMYYTETEIDGKIEDINESINSKEAALQSRISELEAALNPEVHEINVSGGVLTLTNKKYQKCNNIVDGTEIVFPSVSKFTEIHLYFDADSNMKLAFPDCKWRVEPNVEEGGTYEVIATYNTIHWLVTIITYS